MQKKWIIAGATAAMLGVMIGAFGAHALRPILEKNGRLETFETAVRYHFYHAFGLLIIGILSNYLQSKWLNWAGNAMLAGMIIFSASLYLLCLTNIAILGAITPIGGVGMIAGWLFIALAARQQKEQP
ncbi:MAG: DUF423 domain-containing protein [Cytophagales bacterium]|nr:MAG: DUF423 domain-containing protein [Cytophagales bacterium]